MLLHVNLILFMRSIFIPSSARRTLAVSAAAALPLAVYSLATETVRLSVWKVMWLLAAITVASAGSAVIYGLRREVRHARQLGQYTLEEKLGEGGMGVVYRARHAMLRRPTAVKLLRPERMGEASLRRFEREVQLTAGLSHPNTVSVFDFGRTPDGVFYYAMEYLDGLTLDELVAGDGAQPPARVVHILRQVLGALTEAHGIGLVHRDVRGGEGECEAAAVDPRHCLLPSFRHPTPAPGAADSSSARPRAGLCLGPELGEQVRRDPAAVGGRRADVVDRRDVLEQRGLRRGQRCRRRRAPPRCAAARTHGRRDAAERDARVSGRAHAPAITTFEMPARRACRPCGRTAGPRPAGRLERRRSARRALDASSR